MYVYEIQINFHQDQKSIILPVQQAMAQFPFETRQALINFQPTTFFTDQAIESIQLIFGRFDTTAHQLIANTVKALRKDIKTMGDENVRKQVIEHTNSLIGKEYDRGMMLSVIKKVWY